jgi:rod shape-determining protein MreC
LDGVYPPGIPVAKVTKVERNPAYPFAQIECMPIAGVDNHRQLLILSTLPKLPEPPVQAVAAEKPSKSKRKK